VSELAIENGWLVQRLNYHTCGAREGGHCLNEPGCGSSPVAELKTLPGFAEQLEEWRYEARSEVARDIEVLASQGILNSDFRAGMLTAATIVRNETSGS
jgi:hypothetical protein